jgi:predicted nucleic acid-binding protein
VLQEILNRYATINRLDAIPPAFDVLLGVVGEVFPVHAEAVDRAKTILFGKKRISARDALHVAVMQLEGISEILTLGGENESASVLFLHSKLLASLARGVERVQL